MAFPDRVREPATARAAFTEAAACVPDEPPPDEATSFGDSRLAGIGPLAG